MERCWASCLGGCDGKISREHLVSQSLFISNTVNVRGFSWCENETREIGISSLTAKILCEKHNSALSPVDTGGADAFDIFRERQRISNVRQNLKPRLGNVVRYQIDGPLLERWFLKTLINISFDRDLPIGRESREVGKPTCDLVEIAYGHRPFPGRAGLYFVVHAGQVIDSDDRVQFAPLIKNQEYIEAGLFMFRGFRFLLFLTPEGPPVPLTGIGLNDEDWGESQVNYHMTTFREEHGKYLSQVIEILW